MNLFDARELVDGGWYYTCRNDDKIWGVGYDSRFTTCPTCEGHSLGAQPGSAAFCETCEGKGAVEQVPHSPHTSAAAAYECATSYVLDNASWNVGRVDTTHSVPRCSLRDCSNLVPDGRGAQWGFGEPTFSVLCEAHRNRDSLAELVGIIGVIWSS